MARMPRLVVPGYPHHVTQRGNRRMKTFFGDRDYQYYLELLSDTKEEAGIEVWAYCLMPNHVHFVVVPRLEDSLSRLFRSVHRHYSRAINFRENWKGHLWQERFHSFVMDERYLLATVRYVELNPNGTYLAILQIAEFVKLLTGQGSRYLQPRVRFGPSLTGTRLRAPRSFTDPDLNDET